MILSFLSMTWFLISGLCIFVILYIGSKFSWLIKKQVSDGFYFFNKNGVYFVNLLIRFVTQMLFIIILTYPSIYLHAERFNGLIIGLVYLIFTVSFAGSNFYVKDRLDSNTGYSILLLGSIVQILAFLLLSVGALFLDRLLAICFGFLAEGIAIGLLFSSTLFFNLKTSAELKGVFSGLFLAIALSGCLFGLSYSNQIVRILDISKYNSSNFSNYFFVMVGGLFLALICFCSVKVLEKQKANLL